MRPHFALIKNIHIRTVTNLIVTWKNNFTAEVTISELLFHFRSNSSL